MTPQQQALLVAGLALVTFSMRYPLLALFGRLSLPQPLIRALGYVPTAVLTAIIAPAVFMPDGARLSLSPGSAHLAGAAAAALIAWRTRSLLLTIVVGMAVFLIWRTVW